MEDNKAVDFQPLTQNPQGNVNGGLQPVSAAGNIFDQPNINPQAFPVALSLKVLSSGVSLPAGNAQKDFVPSNNGLQAVYLLPIILVILVGIIWTKNAQKT